MSQCTPFITELPRVCVWASTVVYVWDFCLFNFVCAFGLKNGSAKKEILSFTHSHVILNSFFIFISGVQKKIFHECLRFS